MCVDSSSHSSPPSGYAITTLCNRNVPTPASRAARCNLPVPRMRTWVFRSQAPGAEGSGGIAVAAWITASQPAKITGNRDSRPRSSRSASANSQSCGDWGEQLLRFSLIANQTEHLVSSSKQLRNQSASENPSGTRDGYSQLATPTFIFTLLILIRRAALHLRLRTNTGDFRHCGARRIVVVLKLQFHPADLKARRTERLSRRPSCQFSG